jgi:iron complex outermembrane receptor protein
VLLFSASALPVIAATHPSEDLTELSLEELMNVEVTSVSKKGQPLSEAAAAIFVITQEDIRRSGVTSIPEALRMAPGINVAKVDANKWAITARGFNDRYASKLLVLMDGRSIYTPFFAGVYWELQDYALEDIERIEVIRGPGGALWGANAVNGVINIITKKSKDTQGALASTVVGTEEAIGMLRYGGTAGEDFQYRVYGKALNRDSSYAPGGAHDDWRSGRGGFRADWNASSHDSLTVHGNYSDGRAGDRVSLPRLTAPFGTQSQIEDSSLTSHSLLTNWTHRFGSQSETQLRLYYDQYRRDSLTLGERINTYDVDFQHHVALPFGHDVVWGLGYRLMSDRFRTSTTIAMADASRDMSLYSAFVQDQIDLIQDRLSLTLGSKFLHNDFTGFEVQPSARMLWKALPQHSIWAAVSRAVRTPDRFREDATLTVAGTPFGPVRIRNRPLESERVIAYELGYRGQLGSRVTIDLATFYNTYDRLIFTDTVNALTSQYANNARGHTAGAELAAEWRPLDWWTLRPAFTYQQIVISGPPITSTPTTGREGSTPDHQLSLQSRMTWSRQWELDAWYRYVERLTAANIPGYHTLDLRLGWHLSKQLTLDLVGQNLLDKTHQEFRTNSGGTQFTEVQRAGFLRLTWRY